ncbi:SLC13 family permease [Zhihengliuella salsuginis]|uniref:Sodium-dependent dicarboxylate transporter SdcS n=1 Tax=Zhihengliuella salsuginis TaxID=578222 RepID=A0ABQ3GJ14_9MICC|nr:SLC13 family permease [Zhihengliuella salsuginis]GHD05476.1 di- and tricarboxylate transporter [Zhihengliuella salsuginis]
MSQTTETTRPRGNPPTRPGPGETPVAGAGNRPGAGDEQLSQTRLIVGRILGPVLALVVYGLMSLDPSTPNDMRLTAAVVALVATWWMTEAIPLAATSLIPIVALPLLGILEPAEATSPYASPTVFLFMGGFMIAIAMQKWNLHKRIALVALLGFGTRPNQVILGVMVVTAFLSMWVSNTATTLMMLPIALSLLDLVNHEQDADPRESKRFSIALVLCVAYAATIGGLSTLIGSPPNLILAGFVEETYGFTISFADWMKVGVPLAAVFLIIAWFVMTRFVFPSNLGAVAGGRSVIRRELHDLGRMSQAEWCVLWVFISAAFLWVFREALMGIDAVASTVPLLANLSDAQIAIAAGLILFLLPAAKRAPGGKIQGVLDWTSVQQGIPWGVLLLFGGGLSIAVAVRETALSEFLGEKMGGLAVLPSFLLIAAVCLIILLLTEMTSNTATAATFLPVLGGVAIAIGIDPLLILIPGAMAATCSFMLPVGTPPNAIVFGSGHITMANMLRGGIWLNLIGVVLITVAVYALGGWALGIQF